VLVLAVGRVGHDQERGIVEVLPIRLRTRATIGALAVAAAALMSLDSAALASATTGHAAAGGGGTGEL
jgi:hypothetical protein